MDYLIYYHKGDIKIASGSIRRSKNRTTVFDTSGKYFTQIPSIHMKQLNGKIWCNDISLVPDCIKIIQDYAEDLRIRNINHALETLQSIIFK